MRRTEVAASGGGKKNEMHNSITMSSRVQYSRKSHQSRSGLPQERLEVSSCHQLQQDEPGHGLQTHSDTAHDVLVAELTAGTGSVCQKWGRCTRDRGLLLIVWVALTWWSEPPWGSPIHLAQSKPQGGSIVKKTYVQKLFYFNYSAFKP